MGSFLEFQFQNGMNTLLLAMGAFLFSAVVRNPFLVRLCWLAVLIKFLVPPLIGIPLPANLHSMATVARETPHRNPSRTHAGPSAVPVVENGEFVAIETLTQSDNADRSKAIRFEWKVWTYRGLFLVWSIGALVFSIHVFRSTQLFRKLLSSSVGPDRLLNEEVGQLARSMGIRRCPPIRLVDACLSPMVWGLGSSLAIVLPQELLRNLTLKQRQALLVHELVHVQQRDHGVRLLEVVILILFWWNPIAWWARREHHRWEEQCCDARVVDLLPDQRRDYGMTLLVATDFIADRRSIPIATSFARMNVHHRIECVLEGACRPSKMGLRLWSWILVIAVLPWSFSLSQEKRGEEKPPSVGGAVGVETARLPTPEQKERPEWKELNDLYIQLREMNRDMIHQMTQFGKDKDWKAVKEVQKFQSAEYTPKHVRLMALANQFPETDLAFDAAMLTLTTTFYESRDTAVDILSKQMDSSKLAPAFASMKYTFRLKDFCEKAIKLSPHCAVVAHARFHRAEQMTRDGKEDQGQAKLILRDTMIEYPDVVHVPGGWGVVPPDGTIRDVSMKLLARLNANEKVQIGEPLESISGMDVSGEPLSTDEYRGKTTLIVFWATWCSPCMELVTLERKLIDRYRGQPFEIVGVCGDLEFEDDFKAAVKSHGIPYRSFQNELPGGSRISDRLGIPSWPYVVLLDGEGVVREHRFAAGSVVDKAEQERSFQSTIEKWLPNFKPKESF